MKPGLFTRLLLAWALMSGLLAACSEQASPTPAATGTQSNATTGPARPVETPAPRLVATTPAPAVPTATIPAELPALKQVALTGTLKPASNGLAELTYSPALGTGRHLTLAVDLAKAQGETLAGGHPGQETRRQIIIGERRNEQLFQASAVYSPLGYDEPETGTLKLESEIVSGNAPQLAVYLERPANTRVRVFFNENLANRLADLRSLDGQRVFLRGQYLAAPDQRAPYFHAWLLEAIKNVQPVKLSGTIGIIHGDVFDAAAINSSTYDKVLNVDDKKSYLLLGISNLPKLEGQVSLSGEAFTVLQGEVMALLVQNVEKPPSPAPTR